MALLPATPRGRSTPVALWACAWLGCAGPADAGLPEGALAAPLVAACPATVPAAGSHCPQPGGLDCEYGADWNVACNTVAQCWRGGPLDSTWQLQPALTGADSGCPTPTALPGGCPAGPGAAPACQSDLFCPYPQTPCACVSETTSARMPITTHLWVCAAPAAGCPADRPRLGSACAPAQEGLICAYTVCAAGATAACQNGVWREGSLVDTCAGG